MASTPGIPGPTDPPIPSDTRDTFQGLSEGAKLVIIAVGIALATACIVAVWINIFSISSELDYGEKDAKILEAVYTLSRQSNSVDPYLFIHTFDVQVLQKGIANRHALASLSIASGITLFAIGVCLFLIGADGAFKVQASSGASFAVAASGTAPGLLCFVAGTILVGIGATRLHKIDIGGVRLPTANSMVNPGNQGSSTYTTSSETALALDTLYGE